jgi:hypothetical protein
MNADKHEWMVTGDCVEGCTSPPVCPAYWGSPFPKDLHHGESQCEGVWSFNIRDGYYHDVGLAGLKVCYTFNSPSGYPEKQGPWRCVLFIDETASAAQSDVLKGIFSGCWSNLGEVIKVKKGAISFIKEPLEKLPAATYTVSIEGIYNFKMRPMFGSNGQPRYIISGFGGQIYIGKSEINELKEPDLPRNWNRPGMSCTYHDFSLHPKKTFWQP